MARAISNATEGMKDTSAPAPNHDPENVHALPGHVQPSGSGQLRNLCTCMLTFHTVAHARGLCFKVCLYSEPHRITCGLNQMCPSPACSRSGWPASFYALAYKDAMKCPRSLLSGALADDTNLLLLGPKISRRSAGSFFCAAAYNGCELSPGVLNTLACEANWVPRGWQPTATPAGARTRAIIGAGA